MQHYPELRNTSGFGMDISATLVVTLTRVQSNSPVKKRPAGRFLQ
jgi:hypothetical protein